MCEQTDLGNTTFAKVPDQRRTASLPLALHRIRDTRCLYLSGYGVKPAGDTRGRETLNQTNWKTL